LTIHWAKEHKMKECQGEGGDFCVAGGVREQVFSKVGHGDWQKAKLGREGQGRNSLVSLKRPGAASGEVP